MLQHPAAVRAAFEDAATSLLQTVDRVEPHQWELPGLGEWTVRELTAHTLRAFTTTRRVVLNNRLRLKASLPRPKVERP